MSVEVGQEQNGLGNEATLKYAQQRATSEEGSSVLEPELAGGHNGPQ